MSEKDRDTLAWSAIALRDVADTILAQTNTPHPNPEEIGGALRRGRRAITNAAKVLLRLDAYEREV